MTKLKEDYSIIISLLSLVENRVALDSSLSLNDALQISGKNVRDIDRKAALDCLTEASMKSEIGKFENFQSMIAKNALLIAKNKAFKKQAKIQKGEKKTMEIKGESANNDNKAVIAAGSKAKKYVKGDLFKTVSTMSLQLTEANKKASCGYQFSRKTARPGVMDLPEGSEVRYVDARLVYDGVASSKRMIFKVNAGTRVLIDGTSSVLQNDIEVAGVINHIDPDDPYNIKQRSADAKKAEKSKLRAAIALTKVA